MEARSYKDVIVSDVQRMGAAVITRHVLQELFPPIMINPLERFAETLHVQAGNQPYLPKEDYIDSIAQAQTFFAEKGIRMQEDFSRPLEWKLILRERQSADSNLRKCPDCGGAPLLSLPISLPVSFDPNEKVSMKDREFQCQQCKKVWTFQALQQIERIQNLWHEFGYDPSSTKR